MNWSLSTLYQWLKNKPPKEADPVADRSSKDGDNLTDWENDYINKYGKCPDCGGSLLEGPSGGLSTNYLCSKCGSKYNLSGFFNQRISNSSRTSELWDNWKLIHRLD